MLFFPAERLNGALLKRLEPTLRFAGDAIDVRKLAGVLELRCELSATTASRHGNIHDTQLVPFSLPVPVNCQIGNGRWALPGAPTAFCRRGMDVVVNVLTIAQRCLSDGAPKYIADQVAAHFDGDEARHIRSFVSVPLVRSNVAGSDRPCGVVNVNCSVTGILENARRQETILPYLRTMAYMLPPMLDVYAAVHRAETSSRGRRTLRQGP